MKEIKTISLLLMGLFSGFTHAHANDVMQPMVLQNGFGAAGNFVFITRAGTTNTTCTLTGAGALIIYLCLNPNNNDCSTVVNVVSEPNVGDITLMAGSTYHLSAQNVKQMSSGYHANTGSYPDTIQIAQMLCGGIGQASLSSFGIYHANCDGLGCTTADVLTVTFP
jgi:hypothetical protein